MLKLALFLVMTAVFGFAAPAVAGSSPFECRLREAFGYLHQPRTYSGFRWIECVVGVEEAWIDGVSINNGRCEAFDWANGRSFRLGETFNVPYACLSPVEIAIAANGFTSVIRLR
jgi:hypothetical protein